MSRLCFSMVRILISAGICVGFLALSRSGFSADSCGATASGLEGLKEILKGAPQEIKFPAGTEGFIRKTVDLGNCEFASLIRLVGKSGESSEFWVLESEMESAFDHYVVIDSMSQQTLKTKGSDFLRSRKPFTGFLDYSLIVDFLSSRGHSDFRDSCFEELVNLHKFFPVSNLASREPPAKGKKEEACPALPTTKKGDPCADTPGVNLGSEDNSMLRSYLENAQNETGVDAALIASLVTQESRFNPFAENTEEKNYCMNPSAKFPCPKYKWSKGMIQMGSIIAEKYGLDWHVDMPKPEECKESYVGNKCMGALEKLCDQAYAAAPAYDKKYPVYCPKQGLVALGQYISEIINRERKIRVLVKGKKPPEQIVDLGHIINRDLTSQFRYAAGEYNRGSRIDNSIEEHFRQYGKAPREFGHAWSVARNGDTPSREMGYRILSGEYINRCYVWNIAGLCGSGFPKNSLAAYYQAFFKKQKKKAK